LLDGKDLQAEIHFSLVSHGADLNWEALPDQPWITMDPATGSGSKDVVAIVEATALAPSLDPYMFEVSFVAVGVNGFELPPVSKMVPVYVVDTAPPPSTISYTRDNEGRVTSTEDSDGVLQEYLYNPGGTVAEVEFGGQELVEFGYDDNANITSVVSAGHSMSMAYNSLDLLTELDFGDGTGFDFVYDARGLLQTLTYPDGSQAHYQYDGNGNLVQLDYEGNTFTFTYDLANRLVEKTLPNGWTTSYVYDAVGRVQALEHDGPAGDFLHFGYTHDLSGLRLSRTEASPEGEVGESYAYDALGRLVSVQSTDGDEYTYSYDETGNRIAASLNGEVVDYEYDSLGRMVRAGEVYYQYSPAGRLLRKVAPDGITDYVYDEPGRLSDVASSVGEVSYEYDGFGLRSSKSVESDATSYYYAPHVSPEPLLYEATPEGASRAFLHGSFVLGVYDGEWHSFLQDSLGTVRAEVGADGSLETLRRYTPFGTPVGTLSGDTAHGLLAFGGEKYDPETGLIYLRARYYDPGLGRFLTADVFPGILRVPQSLNRYSYAGNDPVNFLDPTGYVDVLEAVKAGVGIIGSTAGIVGSLGLLAAPEPTAVTKVLGVAGLVHSSGALVLNFKKLAEALKDDGAPEEVPGGLAELAAQALAKNSSQEVQDQAKLVGQGVDLVLGFGFASASSVGNTGKVLGAFTKTGKIDKGVKMGAKIVEGVDKAHLGVKTGEFIYNKYKLHKKYGYGYYPYSPFSPNYCSLLEAGGIFLGDKAAVFDAGSSIEGATYDPDTGQLIFVTADNEVGAMPLPTDYVVNLVDAIIVNGAENPAVTIGWGVPDVGDESGVGYWGGVENTAVGMALFEQDYLLKELTLGKDYETGQSIESSVPGYQPYWQYIVDAGDSDFVETGWYGRFWFEPEEIVASLSDDGQAFMFKETDIRMYTELFDPTGTIPSDKPYFQLFADHFNEHFDEFAAEWPEFAEMRQIMQFAALLRWVKENDIPFDREWMSQVVLSEIQTPTSCPKVTVEFKLKNGSTTWTTTAWGGVSVVPDVEYVPQEDVDVETAQTAIDSRPSDDTETWAVQVGELDLVANAVSLAPKRMDGNCTLSLRDLVLPVPGDLRLQWRRTYSSFEWRDRGLGRGWSFVPAVLRFPEAIAEYSQGDAYPRVEVKNLERGQAEIFKYEHFTTEDGQTVVAYVREDSMPYTELKRLADGSYEYRAADQQEWMFDELGSLLSMTDRHGNQLDFIWAEGKLVEVQHSSGAIIAVEYNYNDRPTEIVGPGGTQVTYDYNDMGLLSEVVGWDGTTRNYAYNDAGLLTGETSVDGFQTWTCTYDVYGRGTAQKIPGAYAETAEQYDLASGATITEAPDGTTMVRQFDQPGRLLSITDETGKSMTYTYGDQPLPASITDRNDETTNYIYDAGGRLREVDFPNGAKSEIHYGSSGRLRGIAYPSGSGLVLEHNELGQISKVSLDGQVDPNGDGNSGDYEMGATTYEMIYDETGEVTALTGPTGGQYVLGRDAFGNVSSFTYPEGNSIAIDHDVLGRLTVIENAYGETFEVQYDDDQRQISVGHPGVMSVVAKDEHGRVTEISDPEGRSYQYAYDEAGNQSGVVDPEGIETTYEYDVMGRLMKIHLPDGRWFEYQYDVLGNLAQETWHGASQ